MIDAKRLSKLNKKLKEVTEECDNIFNEIFETNIINKENTFITNAILKRNENNKDFITLKNQIKKYSNCGTIKDYQKSIDSISEMIDFFIKVFKE